MKNAANFDEDKTGPQRVLPPEGLPTPQEREAELRQGLWALMKTFDEAMLVSVSAEGGALRARPLAVKSVDPGQCRVLFLTSIDSPKVEELRQNPAVNVAMQGKAKYVSFSGNATVRRSRELIERLFSPSDKLFFPEGVDDPTICVLEVEGTEAEFWDMTSPKTLKGLLTLAKNLFTDGPRKEPEVTPNKVRLA